LEKEQRRRLEKEQRRLVEEREEAADWEVDFYRAFIPRSKEATHRGCFATRTRSSPCDCISARQSRAPTCHRASQEAGT
jgi:hypothetical protein